jgi:hypothetical protein
LMPSMRAVCALMTSSNLADCTTGKSAGLAPLRMRPVSALLAIRTIVSRYVGPAVTLRYPRPLASRERQNPHRPTVPSVLLGAQVATRYRRAPRK